MHQSLDAYRTKGQLVYEQLKADILAGTPRPGERLVIDRIAAELNVSKVPVREAIDRLIGEGWLARSPHVGPYVPELEPGEVHETAVIRAALESAAIRHAVPHHDQRSLAKVDSILLRMKGTPADYPELNVRLHAALSAPCPYRQLRSMAADQLERTSRYRTVLRLGDFVNETHAEHERIVAAVKAGDAELAASLTEAHILHAAEKLEEHLSTSKNVSQG